jgi:hypothetical protein
MRKIYLVALLACSVVACTPAVAPTSNSAVAAASCPSQAADGTVMDEKGLYAAEAFYNVPAYAYVIADGKGQIKPALKAQLKPVMLKAYNTLVTARAAYKAGNSCGFFETYASLKELSANATSLLSEAN